MQRPNRTNEQRWLRTLTRSVWVAIALATSAIGLGAQAGPAPTAHDSTGQDVIPARPGRVPAASALDVAAFRSAVRSAAEELGVQGSAMAVALPGRTPILLATGVADPRTDIPVDAERTTFRVASVSKVVTATTAAMLAADGTVDLEGDIRPVLEGFAFPGLVDGPITLVQLLTHTGGFDSRVVGMFAREADDIRPLGDYLADRMPPRTSPPDRTTRYSNHGVALAGYVIERAAGMPFDALVDDRLLRPLGMTSSSFDQPLPGELVERLARPGRSCPGADCTVAPLDYRNTVPAGGFVTTAADMATFMADQLGAPPGVLSPAARSLLHRRWFTHDARVPGMALGFHEQTVAGRRALAHSGGSSGYSSILVIVPETGVGLFVAAVNAPSAYGAAVLDAFADAFLPAGARPKGSGRQAEAPHDAERYAGTYLLDRAARASLERFPGLFLYADRVGVGDGGRLVRVDGGRTHRYRFAGDDLFQEVGGPGYLGFRESADGEITGMYADESFFGARFPASYSRLPAYATPHVVNEAFSWAVGIPILAVLGWLLVTGLLVMIRRVRGTPGSTPRAGVARLGVGLAIALTGAMVLFGFGFMARFNAAAMSAPETLAYGLDGSLTGFLRLVWLLPPLALALWVLLPRAWRAPGARWTDRLLLLLTAAFAVPFIVLAVWFRMLPPVV